MRLGVKVNSGGASSFGGGNDPHVSVKGNVPANGGTRYYQIWYRDAATFCAPETYDPSNGLELAWRP